MILDVLMLIVWVIGGGVTSRKAIAHAEKHYLQLAEQAGRPQNCMDTDDWFGAIVFAGAAFLVFPAVATIWLLSYPARWIYSPVRKIMLPPVQQKFEGHVRDLNAQKAIVMNTVKIYESTLKWEPEDDAERAAQLATLRQVITDQMEDLMRIADTTNPTGFDGDFLSDAKDDVKAITAGAA